MAESSVATEIRETPAEKEVEPSAAAAAAAAASSSKMSVRSFAKSIARLALSKRSATKKTSDTKEARDVVVRDVVANEKKNGESNC